MKTLNELMRARGLYARCPNPDCGESFPVRKARLFDATKTLPDYAREHLAGQQNLIAEEWQRLRKERAELKRRSFTSAATITSAGTGSSLRRVCVGRVEGRMLTAAPRVAQRRFAG